MIPEIVLTQEKTEQRTWYGCYDGGWGNNISPASYAHPAKMARNLSQRIYLYMLAQGWLMPGDTVLDPFGGIGGTCLDALTNGLNWVGVELEKRFTDLGQGCDCTGISPEEWQEYSETFTNTIGQLNYKDGRHWCPACIAGALQIKASGLNGHRQPGLFDTAEDSRLPAGFKLSEEGTPYSLPHHYTGNLELFRKYAQPGTFAVLLNGDSRYLRRVISQAQVDGLLSSPPYATGCAHTGGVDPKPEKIKGGLQSAYGVVDGYGATTGQLGGMSEGDLDGLLSSPPYEGGLTAGGNLHSPSTSSSTNDPRGRKTGGGKEQVYGLHPGQLGNMPAGSLADSLLTSPPFAGNSGGRGEVSRNGIDAALFDRHSGGMKRGTGENPDNLDHLPMKGFEAVLSSPPYVNVDPAKNGSGINIQKQYETYRASGGGSSFEAFCQQQAKHSQGYGASEGQLGAMPNGGLDSLLSSPPFENAVPQQDKKFKAPHDSTGYLRGDYGTTTGQLGTEQGQTFWSAARLIVEESYHLLKPGSYSAWVCKKFVRNGQIVDFPGQWQQLCEACGFEYVETIRAMLVSPEAQQGDLDGGNKKIQKSRKSFFRRLSERNGSPAIDYEEVVILRKPENVV
jgi:hypothetical protein